MKSQVSFKFDGSHNKQPIVDLLNNRLPGMKYVIEKLSDYVYRIYVVSTAHEAKTLNICQGIQNFAIYDSTRQL